MNALKTLMIFFLCLNFAGANERIEVTSLNQGSCWVGDLEEEIWKMVNFSQGNQAILSQYQVAAFEEVVLDEIALYSESQSIHFEESEKMIFCGSSSTSLVLNIKMNDFRVCAWASITSEGPKFQRLGVEPLSHQGHCSGSVLGQGIIALDKDSTVEQVVAEMEKILPQYGIERTQIQFTPILKDLYKVSFGKEVYFKEEQLFKQINHELKAQKLIRYFEMNSYQYEAGDFHTLR